jgi:hypothetical protein
MIIDGIIYGYTANEHDICDPPRKSPSGPAVWQATGPITASGQADDDESSASSETPAQKLERLRGERQEAVYAIGALLGGVALAMWLKSQE